MRKTTEKNSREKIAKSFVCSISFPSFHFVCRILLSHRENFCVCFVFQLAGCCFSSLSFARSLLLLSSLSSVNRFVDLVLFMAFLSLYTRVYLALLLYTYWMCVFPFSFLTTFSIFPCSTVGRRSMFWIYSSILLRYIVSVSQFGVQRCCLFRINVLHSVLVGLEFNIVN